MEELKALLGGVTLGQLVEFLLGAAAVVGTLMEFSKKVPFSPWSFLLSRLGRKMNEGLYERVDSLGGEVRRNSESIGRLGSELGGRVASLEAELDAKEAKVLRSKIIGFADSCRVGARHTKTAFENVARDYDDYLELCRRSGTPNHFIDEEFRYIMEEFGRCQRENDFL